MPSDEQLMRGALRLAKRAKGETSPNPLVGAIMARGGKIIGRGWHHRAGLPHAEVEAIADAKHKGNPTKGATLYVTLEPCPMCAGAIVQARLPTVIFGAADPKAGGCQSLYAITNDERLNHRSIVIGGVLEHECGTILSEFFQKQRDLGKK